MVTVTGVDKASEMITRLVIAIDGPSGSGKSSTARGVAKRLGLAYLDTGAMYRAATWMALRDGLTDPGSIAMGVAPATLDISTDPENFWIRIDGSDVTEAIREPRIAEAVSQVAGVQAIRDVLIDQQRSIMLDADRRIVIEGRDITTVVAPDAEVRVLLVADPAARVARREAELGGRVDTAQVTDQVIRRDRDDSRVTSFEDAAPGVRVVDSTRLDLDEVIDVICGLADAAVTPTENQP